MRRREFIKLLGGAAATWSPAARAERSNQMRRIGVLIGTAANDTEGQARMAAFLQGLQELNWSVDRNVRIDIRWTAGNPADTRKYAAELVALTPDVILASGSSVLLSLLEATRAIPIVFTVVADPVGGGVVESLARPGANVTGFTPFEYGMAGKWLELLKEIAPSVTRAGVLRDHTGSTGIGQFAAIQSVAPSLGMEVSAVNVRDVGEIERAVTALASSRGGLVLTGSAYAIVHRDLIVKLSARHKVPTVYPWRIYVTKGGLISYGPDFSDQHRQAAGYVDRILKGEQPADLPVQVPTKYELVINLKTAKTIGLSMPPSVLARADEVIE